MHFPGSANTRQPDITTTTQPGSYYLTSNLYALGITASPSREYCADRSQCTWTGLSFQLDDLREGITRLIECGGSLASKPNDTPEDPLHLAMCIDPEGNEFMMTQRRG